MAEVTISQGFLEKVMALDETLARRSAEFDVQVRDSRELMASLTRAHRVASEQLDELKRANTAAALIIEDYVREERNAEDRRAARLEARPGRSLLELLKPLLFIVAATFAWWLVNFLANLVITCIPGGAPCNPSEGPLVPARELAQMTIPQWVMLSVSLAIALLGATICVYGNKDTD